MTHAHEISIFVNILFNFKKKKLAWKKLKASLETLYFNIVKNQEFELITSSHFKNLISPRGNPHGTVSETVFNSGTVFKKFKAIASMPILRLYFRFKKKKDFSDIPVNLGMGVLVLITSSVQVEIQLWWYNNVFSWSFKWLSTNNFCHA